MNESKDTTGGAAGYRPYGGLPPLAGLCSFGEAAAEGLSVGACVARLKRYHYALKRLSEILTGLIPAEPIYELKMAFAHHAHLCAEHATALRGRVGEMREPPLGLSKVPHAGLELFFDEIAAAPSREERLLGIYATALPALALAVGAHRGDTNPLADAPSVRLCRFALVELGDMIDYGEAALAALVDEGARAAAAGWLDLLGQCLEAAGGLSGAALEAGGDGGAKPAAADGDGGGRPPPLPAPRYSAQAPAPDYVPRRDGRFPDPYNMGVHAEAFLYDERFPADAKVLMMFFKRLREIDVPEMMASILAETEGKPWAYTREMLRQVWDEARHAMMGEAGFVSLGVDWTRAAVNFTWSHALNTQLGPWERHGVLYFIEQGLMSRTGKRYEWEVATASAHPLAKTFQDYDWADEVLHAKIGRDWYVSQFDSPKEAVAFGDQAWSKVYLDWNKWRRDGLTGHANWWPDLYRAYCQQRGLEPDPGALAFATTYEESRADLKGVEPGASG